MVRSVHLSLNNFVNSFLDNCPTCHQTPNNSVDWENRATIQPVAYIPLKKHDTGTKPTYIYAWSLLDQGSTDSIVSKNTAKLLNAPVANPQVHLTLEGVSGTTKTVTNSVFITFSHNKKIEAIVVENMPGFHLVSMNTWLHLVSILFSI